MAVGDTIFLRAQFGLRVRLDIRSRKPCEILDIDAYLPFGVVNHESIRLTRLADGRCRVSFN